MSLPASSPERVAVDIAWELMEQHRAALILDLAQGRWSSAAHQTMRLRWAINALEDAVWECGRKPASGK